MTPDEEQSARRYGLVTAGFLYTYCVLGVFVASYVPPDILHHQWARELIAVTAAVFPSFMDVPAKSPIPDVVRFYFGVMWLVMPLFWCGMVISSVRWPSAFFVREEALTTWRTRWRAIAIYIAVLLITTLFFVSEIGHLYAPDSGKWARAMYRSRTSVAIAATLVNASLLFCAGLVVWLPRAIFHAWGKLPWFQRHS